MLELDVSNKTRLLSGQNSWKHAISSEKFIFFWERLLLWWEGIHQIWIQADPHVEALVRAGVPSFSALTLLVGSFDP